MAVYSVCKLDDIEGSYAGGLAASSATLPDVAPSLRRSVRVEALTRLRLSITMCTAAAMTIDRRKSSL